MNHDQAIQELRDFFCGYRRFKGMLLPQDSRIFEAYFLRLAPADQQLLTHLIVAGALGTRITAAAPLWFLPRSLACPLPCWAYRLLPIRAQRLGAGIQ